VISDTSGCGIYFHQDERRIPRRFGAGIEWICEFGTFDQVVSKQGQVAFAVMGALQPGSVAFEDGITFCNVLRTAGEDDRELGIPLV
jgi:hypothetical protein